jgi:hypothetical protein
MRYAWQCVKFIRATIAEELAERIDRAPVAAVWAVIGASYGLFAWIIWNFARLSN